MKREFKEVQKAIRKEKREKRKEDLAKLKEMSFEEKKNYFIDYYLLKVVITIVVIACIVGIIATYMKNNYETVLNITVMNGGMVSKDDWEQTLNKVLGANSDSKRIVIDDENYLISDDSTVSSSALEKIQTMFYSNELDVYIGMKIDVDFYADRGYLKDLSDFVDKETFDKLVKKDMIYYVSQTRYNENDEAYLAEIPYGIKVNTLPFYKESGLTIEKPMLCVIASSHRQKTIKKFIDYILEE